MLVVFRSLRNILTFMKWTLLVWILSAWVSISLKAQTANEVAESKSRSRQVERSFSKVKTPAPAAALAPTNAPASKVKLTGFTTLGVSRAFFILIDEKANASHFIALAVDEEIADLKLIQVDPALRSVRVLQDGVEKELTLDQNGAADSIGVAPPAAASRASRGQSESPRSVNPRNSAQTSPRNRGARTREGDSSDAPAVGNRSRPSRSESPESQSRRDRRSSAGNRPPRP